MMTAKELVDRLLEEEKSGIDLSEYEIVPIEDPSTEYYSHNYKTTLEVDKITKLIYIS